MRLLRFERNGEASTGILTPRGIVDLPRAADIFYDFDLPTSLDVVLTDMHAHLDTLSAFIEAALDVAVKMAALGESDEQGPTWLIPPGSVKLLSPLTAPQKIICVGKNYAEHATELGGDVPEYPILFSKFNNTLNGHGGYMPYSSLLTQLDYEAELAVVIGLPARDVTPADALNYVFGYCNANDFTDRGLQKRTSQWTLGKSLDGALPLGPFVLTADELPDPQALELRCWVNGELRQQANTKQMVFPVAHLVSYISQYMSLLPGDVILTGTPAGVAAGMDPPPWLQSGDEIAVEISKLGRLVNRIGAAGRA
ncbi:MAG: fumarylacetoacetate hydrolase family protein [Anaerolineales bacterium]